jgi:hypothetical protein
VRNLTLVKCTPGHPASYGTSMPAGALMVFGTRVPVAGPNRRRVIVEHTQFVSELPAARIQAKTTDLPYIASASVHERRT